MKRLLVVAAMACSAALCVVSCEGLLGPEVQSPAPVAYVSRLATLLDSLRYALDLPALSGAIVTANCIVDAQAVGCRRYGGAVNITVNDQFHLGSCGKAITATLLGVLVDEGRVSWATNHGTGRMRLTCSPPWLTGSQSAGAFPRSSHCLFTGLFRAPTTGTTSTPGTRT